MWWLPQGQATPRELLVPTPGAGHELWLHDAFVLDGHLTVLYTRSQGAGLQTSVDRLRRFDVETGAVIEVYSQSGWDMMLDEVWHADGVIGFTRYEMHGHECVFLALDGELASVPAPPHDDECFVDLDAGLRCADSCRLDEDGDRLVFETYQQGASTPKATVVVRDAVSGTDLARAAIPDAPSTFAGSIDIAGDRVLVNRRNPDGYVEALLIDLGETEPTPTPLPLEGHAVFARGGVAIDLPVTPTAPSLVISGPEGVYRWQGGRTAPLVDGAGRVAFALDDGSVVYQLQSTSPWPDMEPIMLRTTDGTTRELVGTDGVAPRLWGVGEIDGNPQVVFEPWPVPRPSPEHETCEGPLLSRDLVTGTTWDLHAFSAPGYGLGLSGVQGGIVLAFNTGSEIGEVGGFRLMDLEGNDLPNPMCVEAVDCSDAAWVLGALSPDGERLAFVIDHMVTGDETEYRAVERRFGVVDVATGVVELSLTLPLERDLGWLDYDGRWAVVSLRAGAPLLIDAAGMVTELPLEGTATLAR